MFLKEDKSQVDDKKALSPEIKVEASRIRTYFGKESYTFFCPDSPRTQFGIGIAIIGVAFVMAITWTVLVSLNILSLGLALPITILAIGLTGATVAGTTLLRDDAFVI